MRAARLFLRARAVIKYVLRAASTLKNTDGEQQFCLVGDDVKLHHLASRSAVHKLDAQRDPKLSKPTL